MATHVQAIPNCAGLKNVKRHRDAMWSAVRQKAPV